MNESQNNPESRIGRRMIWLAALGLLGGLYALFSSLEGGGSSVSSVDTSSTVVILEQDRSGHYETPGMINGQPVTFLVDTGAPLPFFLRALNPTQQGFTDRWAVRRIPTFLGGGFQDLPLLGARFKRIELGTWTLENETGYLLDLSAQHKRVYRGDLDALMNLIGTPFLRTLHAVHIDMPNRAMYLDKPE